MFVQPEDHQKAPEDQQKALWIDGWQLDQVQCVLRIASHCRVRMEIQWHRWQLHIGVGCLYSGLPKLLILPKQAIAKA